MAITSPVLNLLILDTHDMKTLGVADYSQYPTGFSIVNPSLEIIPPSFPVSTKNFSANSLNLYNSNDVGITCVTDDCFLTELPDGYWQVKYSIAPAQTYSVTKSFMRTQCLQRTLEEAFLSLDLDQCDLGVKDQDMRLLDEINYYLQTSIAAGNQCNPKLALETYKIADRMLTNFLKSKCYGLQRKPVPWV